MTQPNEGLDFSYDTYLSQVPETLRDQIEPLFKEYSDGVQGKVSETYGNLDPYKDIVDGWQPEHVATALSLLETLNTNPEQIYQGLIQNFPELGNQGQPQVTPSQTPLNSNNFNLPPEFQTRFNQMEDVIQLLAQGFQQQQSVTKEQQAAAQEQAEMAALNQEIEQVAPETKYPRQFILAYMAQGMTPQQAATAYTEWETSRFQQQASQGTPLIAPGNGGNPSQRVDTSKLSDTDRKALLVQALTAANQQSQ